MNNTIVIFSMSSESLRPDQIQKERRNLGQEIKQSLGHMLSDVRPRFNFCYFPKASLDVVLVAPSFIQHHWGDSVLGILHCIAGPIGQQPPVPLHYPGFLRISGAPHPCPKKNKPAFSFLSFVKLAFTMKGITKCSCTSLFYMLLLQFLTQQHSRTTETFGLKLLVSLIRVVKIQIFHETY